MFPANGSAQTNQELEAAPSELGRIARRWLALSLGTLLFGGCCFGLVGASFQLLAIQALGHGAVRDAQEKIYWGRIITIAGTIMQVLLLVIALLYVFKEPNRP
jgi:hypothetical protein